MKKKVRGAKAKAGEAALSRKAKRKEERKLKKQKKQDFMLRRFGKTTKAEEQQTKRDNIAKKRQEDEAKRLAAQLEKSRKAEREREKSKRKRLKEENEAEEKTLKTLEKKLKMNKRKSGGLPKSFTEDGLDFLLDACDTEKLQNWREEEEEEKEEGSSDQELSEEDDKGDGEAGDEEGMDVEGEAEEDEQDDSDDGDENFERDQEDQEDRGEESPGEDAKGTWEDIYGRTRDSTTGGVIPASSSGKYIPPALRARVAPAGGEEEDAKRKEKLDKLRRRCKGLLNRLASATMSPLVRELEELYSDSGHARADLNECLFSLLSEALLDSPVRTPERMLVEHALLVALLHANVGIEVGATVLQMSVQKYRRFREEFDPEANGKEQDNALLFISHLFTFKVVEARLIFDIMSDLAESFSEKDIELVVSVLRAVGFGLRKADPARMKELILLVRRRSSDAKEKSSGDNRRVDFMLDVLMAVKNNNVRKMPNYDDEHQQFLLKAMKQWLRPGCQPSPLAVGLKDLLEAESRGRWWIVGSAWTGEDAAKRPLEMVESSYNSELLEKARLMRMNTDVRRAIFCTVMSASDYADAFERVVKLKVSGKQREREVAFVLLDCCLQEKTFNRFYSELLIRLCEFERKFMLATQFALWDKIKTLDKLEKFQCHNLSDLTSTLLCRRALPISALKVVDFAQMDRHTVVFLRRALAGPTGPLRAKDDDDDAAKRRRRKMFGSLSASSASSSSSSLSTLREGLRLFMRHFVVRKDPTMETAVREAEEAMAGGEEGKLRL